MSVFEWLPWVRARRTRELADELRAHLEMAETDRIARGESPSEAALNARREFGNAGLAQEIARDEWSRGGLWLEHFAQDVHFATRMLRRAPAFASVVILTIAVGIGATTAIFSVVNATLLHPLPYPHAERLVRIEDDLVGLGARDIGMSTPEWHDLERSGVFDFVSPTWFDDNNLTGLEHAQRVGLLIVAPNYFALLGVKPQLGAGFDPGDATPGFNGEAVISDGLWKTAFGGDRKILGRVVQLDSDSYRIVGVMPAGFQAPGKTREERGTQVWPAFGFAGAPLNQTSVESRRSLFAGALGRVKAGLTIDDAQRRIDLLVGQLRKQFPKDYPPVSDWRIRLVPLKSAIVGDVRQPLLFLFGAVVLVLLIACANVANLLLTRATARSRELAVRQALGGAPSRLVRQLLTESILLSGLGGLAGVLLLVGIEGVLVRLVPDSVPRVNEITIDWGVLIFAVGASIIVGVVFGLAPALQIRGLDLIRALKLDGRGTMGSRGQNRTRRGLVIAELALSVVLVTAAGLLVRSFWRLLDAPLGFDPRNITVLHTRLPYPNDPKEDLYPTVGAEETLVRELIRRSATIAGVTDVAIGSGAAVPLDHPQQDQTSLRVMLEGDAVHGDQPLFITGAEVTPEYFGLLGVPLRRGRLLDQFDTDSTPSVAVINESMARTYWPNTEALGRRMRLSSRSPAWTTVVGVVADARTESLASASAPEIYVSLYQRQGKHLSIFVRGHFETNAIERAIRGEIHELNAALPVFGVRSLQETVSASLAVRRLSLILIAAFAITALLLAALGIYGVTSYLVAERTPEIGVRLALGASEGDVLRLVMRQGVQLAFVGAIAGLVGALSVARLMSDLLFGVPAADPLTFAGALVLLTSIALAACYLPARRALRVDPIVTLRA